VDLWWASHVDSKMHRASIQDDGEPSPEERLLNEIFGTSPQPRVPGRDRRGALIDRPGVGAKRWREDNPKGS